MKEQKQQQHEQSLSRAAEDKYGGRQGVDKDPSSDGATGNVQFEQETQKGKQKVDADLDEPKDRASGQEDL